MIPSLAHLEISTKFTDLSEALKNYVLEIVNDGNVEDLVRMCMTNSEFMGMCREMEDYFRSLCTTAQQASKPPLRMWLHHYIRTAFPEKASKFDDVLISSFRSSDEHAFRAALVNGAELSEYAYLRCAYEIDFSDSSKDIEMARMLQMGLDELPETIRGHRLVTPLGYYDASGQYNSALFEDFPGWRGTPFSRSIHSGIFSYGQLIEHCFEKGCGSILDVLLPYYGRYRGETEVMNSLGERYYAMTTAERYLWYETSEVKAEIAASIRQGIPVGDAGDLSNLEYKFKSFLFGRRYVNELDIGVHSAARYPYELYNRHNVASVIRACIKAGVKLPQDLHITSVEEYLTLLWWTQIVPDMVKGELAPMISTIAVSTDEWYKDLALKLLSDLRSSAT